jgi:hypothetical protein
MQFSAAGVAQGGEIRICQYTAGDCTLPRVAVHPLASEFIVVWQSYGQDGSENGIYAQKFTAAGSPIGAAGW